MELPLPDQFALKGSINGNPVRQLAAARRKVTARLSPLSGGKVVGHLGHLNDGRTIAFVARKTSASLGADGIVLVDDAETPDAIASCLSGGSGKWLAPPAGNVASLERSEMERIAEDVFKTWNNAFTLETEQYEVAVRVKSGLRLPQTGAVHAALAHWSVTNKPATIVMPTGTGKTETMLALTVQMPFRRVLVALPPNKELRDQIADKFLRLGILHDTGCLKTEARLPIVAELRHIPKSAAEIDELFLRSNVIVTTMQIAGQTPPELQAHMASLVDVLFIDEAHHVPARTWAEFKSHFTGCKVMQFTATPFRTDGRLVDGRFIYVYPLRKAQEENYFKPIRFEAVQGLDVVDADLRILAKVASHLDTDLAAGLDHLAMARVNGVERAKALHALYAEKLGRYRPVLIHSKMSAAERKAAFDAMRSRQSRIIVCVDMLGEGFDMPELKIAAIHDKHKSIAVTLQFTGRFTRSRTDLGDAKVIANIANDDIADSLRSLYAEDADWNYLLTVIGGAKTSREVRRAKIFDGFKEKFESIPLQTLYPRMSTVVYQVSGDVWKPFAVDSAFPPASVVEGPIINETARLALFVTRDEDRLRWSTVKHLVNVEWNLYLVHWDETRNLLFINSSRSGDLHEQLAKAIAGDDARRITGENLFRVLDGFKRLFLMNLGLSETQRKPIRYAMYIGSDIVDQLADAAKRNRVKNNLFGQGYTHEGKSTIGCSIKGKIWSHDADNDFSKWIEWCHEVGRKLLDSSIQTDGFIRNLIKPRQIRAHPGKPSIAVVWPEAFIDQPEERVTIFIGGDEFGFHDCTIDLDEHSDSGPLRFSVQGGDRHARFEMTIDEQGAQYVQTAGDTASVRIGGKTRELAEAFRQDPPHFYFADGDMLLADELFELIALHRDVGSEVVFPKAIRHMRLPPGYTGTRSVAMKFVDLFDGGLFVAPDHGTAALPGPVTCEEALSDLAPITAHLKGGMVRGARRLDSLTEYPPVTGGV